MSEQVIHSYRFGRFSLNTAERVLLRDGELVPLGPKAVDVLVALVENGGRLVEKDDLMKRVWPTTFVEEGNLTQNISLLRKALGETANGPQFIETIPRRGYRFVAEIKDDTGVGIPSVGQASGESSKQNGRRIYLRSPKALNKAGSLGQTESHTQWRARTTALVLTAVAVGLIIAGVAYFGSKGTAREAAIDSIAVVPFESETTDSETAGLDDEIAATLVNSLSKLPKLRVVPRSVMLNYKGLKVDPRKIGNDLNVRAIVTGRVRRRGETITIEAELIDVQNLSQLWGQQYERRLVDILLVQEEISRDIFENLRLKLNVEEQKQLDAYRLYLKGRNAWNKRTAEALQQGIDYFHQAIQTDPSYAPAYAGLADCYNMQVIYGIQQPNEAFPKAKEAATKALEIDDTLAEAHTSLAFVKFRWDRDRIEAEREFQLAIKHKPTYAPAHQWYSSYLVAFERFDEAIAEAKRAQQLEPLSFIASSHLAWILYLSGQPDAAIAECNRMLKLAPNFFPAHRYLGLAYEQKGMRQKAIAEFQRGLQLSGSPLMLALLGHAHAVAGNTSEARKILNELSELRTRRYVASSTVAAIHAGLGEKDEAFKWLEKAYEERDVWLMNLKVDPVFSNIKSDARFQDLLTRTGLRP